MYTEKFTEAHELLDKISPVSSSTAVNGSWVSVAEVHRGVALFQTGLVAASGTVDFIIEQAQDSSGTGAKAFKAATQLTDAGDNESVAIEFRSEELDVDNGFYYVRISATCATAAALVSGELLGVVDRYGPAPTTPWQEVV